MWWSILLIILAVGAAYLLLRGRRREEEPHDTYVCDICGQTECLCHKEDQPLSR